MGIVRFEVFARRLRIRMVSQGVVCVYKVSVVLVLMVSWLIVCVSSFLPAVTLHISFWMYHLPKRHMMCVHFESFIGLLCIIVLA